MIKQSGVTLDQQIRRLAGASKEFKSMISAELSKIEPIAEDMMQDLSGQKKNNITSNMVDSLKAEVAQSGTQLRFGFIGGAQLYYQLQTVSGFTHGGAGSGGKEIRASLAIADTKILLEPMMMEAAKRVRRNFMARLRGR